DAADAQPEQAPHVPLQAFHPPGGAEAGAFRLEPRGAASNQKADLVAADSTRIAELIAGALAGRGLPGGSNRRYSPGDFLILLRRRNNMRSYAAALEQRGVPFEIAGGDAFKGEEDLAVLVTALRAIADPDDPVSLVATLRGPLFGVDDRALYLFRKSGGRFAFDSRLPRDADPRIERAFALLKEGQRLSETLPAAAAVTRFTERLGWIASRAAGEIGDTRAGNLLKALAVIRDRSREGGSFDDIVRGLDELALAGEAEEMTSTPGRSGVTRLMTVHAAKGLEARVVFLADPTDFDPPGPRFSIERGEMAARGHFCVWKKTGEHGRVFIALPRNWAEHEAREKSFDAAERTRLLYVAATRARETTIVSTRLDAKKKWRGSWGALGPFLTRELSSSQVEPGAVPEVLGAAALEHERELASASRAQRRSLSERPGYRAITVTTLAHDISDPASRPFASSTGKGMSWGSALHRLLEAVMRDPSLDVRAFAANVLAEEDRPPGDLDEAVATVEGVRRSALWKRALAAKQCLVEVPFALSLPSSDLGLPADGPAETLLSGAIDLVFEEKDGWILVDYKSDTVAGNLDALVAFYSPQIEHYRRVWRDLTGQPTRAGLFFLDGAREVWLPD
ncbi:MAG TPA: 3'-5' exonuclease, partial [Thermoanaerobaculia bacterium]|nr:3'-5' exonuclease [Thermoanaerobaculia bacterium]